MNLKANTDLHRLVWSPDDFSDGKLLTSAFRRADLSGGDDFVSVSRVDKLNADAEIAMAKKQAERFAGVEFSREKAFSALLSCKAIQLAKDDNGDVLFEVTSEPIEINEAHCGIRNVTGKSSRGHINKLRSLLVQLVHKSQTLDDFLQSLEK